MIHVGCPSCSPCPTHCDQCSSPTVCEECTIPYLLSQSQCVESCPESTFPSTDHCKGSLILDFNLTLYKTVPVIANNVPILLSALSAQVHIFYIMISALKPVLLPPLPLQGHAKVNSFWV